MNLASPHIESIAQVIQLSVAPVFLLAGVGATLNVLTSRLSRVVDRARSIEERLRAEHLRESHPELHAELISRLQLSSQRARLINWAIALSVLCSLLVPLVIVALFVSALLKLDLSVPIALGFIVALLSLSSALLFFLREVFIATRGLRFTGAGKT